MYVCLAASQVFFCIVVFVLGGQPHTHMHTRLVFMLFECVCCAYSNTHFQERERNDICSFALFV